MKRKIPSAVSVVSGRVRVSQSTQNSDMTTDPYENDPEYHATPEFSPIAAPYLPPRQNSRQQGRSSQPSHDARRSASEQALPSSFTARTEHARAPAKPVVKASSTLLEKTLYKHGKAPPRIGWLPTHQDAEKISADKFCIVMALQTEDSHVGGNEDLIAKIRALKVRP